VYSAAQACTRVQHAPDLYSGARACTRVHKICLVVWMIGQTLQTAVQSISKDLKGCSLEHTTLWKKSYDLPWREKNKAGFLGCTLVHGRAAEYQSGGRRRKFKHYGIMGTQVSPHNCTYKSAACMHGINSWLCTGALIPSLRPCIKIATPAHSCGWCQQLHCWTCVAWPRYLDNFWQAWGKGKLQSTGNLTNRRIYNMARVITVCIPADSTW
jgi:hypothetical protein